MVRYRDAFWDWQCEANATARADYQQDAEWSSASSACSEVAGAPGTGGRRQVCEGAFIERYFEELENLFMSVKDYIRDYGLPFLQNADFDDFCKLVYQLSVPSAPCGSPLPPVPLPPPPLSDAAHNN